MAKAAATRYTSIGNRPCAFHREFRMAALPCLGTCGFGGHRPGLRVSLSAVYIRAGVLRADGRISGLCAPCGTARARADRYARTAGAVRGYDLFFGSVEQ